MIKMGTLVTRDKKTDMSERNDVDLPDKAKEEVEEDGEGEEDNEDGNAEEDHGGHGDGNDGPYDDGCDANAVKC